MLRGETDKRKTGEVAIKGWKTRRENKRLAEPIWQDWFRCRVEFLMSFSKEPRRDAFKIAKAEMALLQKSTSR